MSKNKISWIRRKLVDIIAHLYPNTSKCTNNVSQDELSRIVYSIMDSKWKQFPNNWGKDGLSKFIDELYISNIVATYHNPDMASQYECLQTIWECFRSIDGKVKDPKSRVAMHLFLRAASAYSASCIASMAGQSSETYALLRSCLEYGAYGFYIYMDTSKEEVWLQKGNSEDGRKKFLAEFIQRKLCDSIKEKDVGLAESYGSLYECTIDYGAHPNEPAVKQGYYEKENEVGLETGQLFLSANPETIKALLNKTVETGVTVLQMIRIIYPKIFEDCNITAKLSEVTEVLEQNSP